MPSVKSSVRAHSSWTATSCSSVAASAGLAALSSTRLTWPTATGAQASSSPTSAVGRRLELVRGGDAVDQADPLGLRPVDHPPGHHELLGAAETHHGGQARGAADVGDEADAGLGHADERVGGHHAQVAGQRELHGAADAGAVDLADRRLGHLLEQVPRLEDRTAELAQAPGIGSERGEAAEVHPAGEHRARAAHDHAEDVAIGGGGLERLAQAEDQLVVEGVALLGTVEDDVAHGAAVLGQDGAHARIMTAFQLASRPLMLRPLPHRGDVVAAGAVALAALVALLQVRFNHTWDDGIHFVYSAAALAFVGTLALQAPREGDAPRAYMSALLAVTFALAVPTLARLALILGSDGLDSSGTLVWVGAALAALGFGLAAARGSELCVLLGAVSLVLAVLGFVDEVFSPGGVTTFRWLLVALVAGFALATVATRDRRPKRAVALADAGGLTALALALTFAFDQIFGSSPLFGPGAGTGWEAFLYACGFGLCAFSAVDRPPARAGSGWPSYLPPR